MATILGLNPFRSAFEEWLVWTEKEKPKSFDGNDHTRLGEALEPYIGDLFARKLNVELVPNAKLWQHDELEWAVCTPDFFVQGGDAIVETKHTSYRRGWEWDEQTCPEQYLVQLQWQLGVCECSTGYVAGLVGGDPREFYYPRFEFDSELWERMVERAEAFLQCVKSDIPPPAGSDDRKLIQRAVDKRLDKPAELSPLDSCAFELWVEEINLARRKIRALREEVKELTELVSENENNILIKLKDCSHAELSDGRVIRVIEVARKAYQVPESTHLRLVIPK